MDMHNYEKIKEAAKALGVRVTDLLALAPQNDPFYAGTPTDQEQARWFADVWRKAGYSSGVHLRRVHYWCVSQDGLPMHNGQPYENTEKCWGYLLQASKMARYLGYVRIQDVADHKSPAPLIRADYDLYTGTTPHFEIDTPELSEPQIWIGGIHNVNVQPYHLEVWCEKSTMNDVLDPLCSRYNANLCTFEGEVSITACYQFVQRLQASGSKPARLFYISDFDPAGNSMPVATARKIEYMLQQFQCDSEVKLKPVALTLDQIQEYSLPRTPIKDTEKRAGKFEAAFGTGAVELDALEALYPGELSGIVSNELETYYSEDAQREVWAKRAELQEIIEEQVREITDRYQPEIEAIRKMQEELEAIAIDTEPYTVERYYPEVRDGDGTIMQGTPWLFDSTRDYDNQIAYYKEHKGQTSAV